jgi:hypothetical protein
VTEQLKQSVWAVAAGILAVIISTTLVDLVLHLVRFYPAWDAPLNDAQSGVATLYRTALGIGGAWLTAKLAPTSPMRHVFWLGILGTVLGAIGAITTWNKNLGPHWYGIALAVLALPQSWLGGKIFLANRGDK